MRKPTPISLPCAFVALLVLTVALAFEASAQIPLVPQRITVTNELDVNSAGTDYPAGYTDEGFAYISTATDPRLKQRLKPPRKGSDALERIFLAERAVAGALSPLRDFMPGLFHKVNAGPLTVSPGEDIAYVTRNAAPPRRRGGKVASRLQVFEVTRSEQGQWGGLEPLEFAEATGQDTHPALSADGALLVFASDRDGGYGGLDLWGVRRNGDLWGAPFNLGPDVNTGGQEAFPFLHADGTLYYATTVAGEGEAAAHFDLAYTRESGGDWGAPTFLGAPFNTPGDDFALVVDADNRGGYFASDRTGGLGRDDIYRFDITGVGADTRRAPAEMAIAVTDASSGRGLAGASVRYLDADTATMGSALRREVITVEGKPLQVRGGDGYVTDVRGEGVLSLREGTFLLEVAREGYEPQVLPVTLAPGQSRVSVALSRKQACAEIRVSVVEEPTVFPVANALLAAVPDDGDREAVEARTGDDGTVVMCLPCGGVYTVNAIAGTLQGDPVTYDARGGDCGTRGTQTTLTAYLRERVAITATTGVVAEGTPLAAGTRFQMPAVYYALNDYRLNDAARADLDELGRLMRQFPSMSVELGSHTDANGPAAFNRDLSQRRADEARRYLMEELGVEGSRVVAVGYGESRLRNGCRDGVKCSAARHRENRRTEVTILGEGVPSGLASLSSTAGPSRDERATSLPRQAPREASFTTTYYVISGVFSDRGTAAPSAKELQALGYDGVRVAEVPGVRGFAVVGGQFASAQEARHFARALKEAHGREAYVHRVSQ